MATLDLLRNCQIWQFLATKTFELLTSFEQQKVATSGNFLTAHNCHIWQFLSRPKIDKTGNCLQFPKFWQLLFFALNTTRWCSTPQDGVQSYRFWQ